MRDTLARSAWRRTLFCSLVLGSFLFALVAATGSQPALRWYKGNTHTHTTTSDGDSDPPVVAQWYHDRGFHFLSITDHNTFLDPDTVRLSPDNRKDFILIPGQEVTGRKSVHTTGFNVRSLVPWEAGDVSTTANMRFHIDGIYKAGGRPILNHPNFKWAVTAADIRPLQRLRLFELYNGSTECYNFGDASHASLERMWDRLLTAGYVMYGVASDDTHNFKNWDPIKKSNPGRGWVMVQAAELTSGAITAALEAGDFYSTMGVILRDLTRTAETYRVTIDDVETRRELAFPTALGHPVATGEPGYRIEFIGKNGTLLKTVRGTDARYDPQPGDAYVRARAISTRMTGRGYEEFYAWTQPVFINGK